MKFSQHKCKECGSNDLEILRADVDETVNPAVATMTFQCLKCGYMFDHYLEAINDEMC